ncbi:MAG: ABC transporter substrate-binding protein [Treponema sp.]|nr:ABC transporter substrate-binding protein [Treponema sp.]
MKKIILAFLCISLLAGTVWARGAQSGSGSGSGNIQIALITMDSVDEHWLKLNNGAQDKAKELGNVTVTWSAPQVGKVDAAAQLQLIEDAITRRVSVLMLAPLHAEALVPGIEKAKAAGVKVVLVDSGANTEAYDAFLFTDNAAAARLAADELAKVINGQGKVAIINAQAGAGTTMTRENEFKAQMASKYPGVTIVGTQYSDGDATRALNIATDFMTANPDLAGIYACNEGSTTGAGNGIEQAGKGGVVRFVGFDWSDNTKALIERGVLDATMVQNPYQMGYQGVQAGVDLVNGKPVQRQIDTGVTVATKANAATIK